VATPVKVASPATPVSSSISRRVRREADFIVPVIGDDAAALDTIPI